MWQADGYKMDYGGHDTVIADNIFWKEGGDNQNCINTWPYVAGKLFPLHPPSRDGYI